MAADGEATPVPGSPEDRAERLADKVAHWMGHDYLRYKDVHKDIAAAIRDAVAAERERCAGVAEGLAAARQQEFDEYSDRWDEGAAANLRRLAELIRQGPVPPGGTS